MSETDLQDLEEILAQSGDCEPLTAIKRLCKAYIMHFGKVESHDQLLGIKNKVVELLSKDLGVNCVEQLIDYASNSVLKCTVTTDPSWTDIATSVDENPAIGKCALLVQIAMDLIKVSKMESEQAFKLTKFCTYLISAAASKIMESNASIADSTIQVLESMLLSIKASTILSQQTRSVCIAKCYFTIGSIHGKMNDFSSAIVDYQLAVNGIEESYEDQDAKPYIYSRGIHYHALACYGMEDMITAERLFNDCIKSLENIDDDSDRERKAHLKANCYRNLAAIKNDSSTRIELLQQGKSVMDAYFSNPRNHALYIDIVSFINQASRNNSL